MSVGAAPFDQACLQSHWPARVWVVSQSSKVVGVIRASERWPSHARFHGVVALTMTSTLAGLNLWSLWSGSTDRRTSRLFAAAVPVGYWAPFFLAPLVRGTGMDDPPHPVSRVAGVPTSLLGAAGTTLTAVAGWLLDRRTR